MTDILIDIVVISSADSSKKAVKNWFLSWSNNLSVSSPRRQYPTSKKSISCVFSEKNFYYGCMV